MYLLPGIFFRGCIVVNWQTIAWILVQFFQGYFLQFWFINAIEIGF